MKLTLNQAIRQVRSNDWPRSISVFPSNVRTNCVGFALDLPGYDFSYIVGICYYDPAPKLVLNLMDLLKDLGLSPREIRNVDSRQPDEFVFIVYNYSYKEWDSLQDCKISFHEYHFARVELDGTMVEKIGWDNKPCVTSLEQIHNRILQEDGEDVSPMAFIAVRKP